MASIDVEQQLDALWEQTRASQMPAVAPAAANGDLTAKVADDLALIGRDVADALGRETPVLQKKIAEVITMTTDFHSGVAVWQGRSATEIAGLQADQAALQQRVAAATDRMVKKKEELAARQRQRGDALAAECRESLATCRRRTEE
jgi:hypothetical protein